MCIYILVCFLEVIVFGLWCRCRVCVVLCELEVCFLWGFVWVWGVEFGFCGVGSMLDNEDK